MSSISINEIKKSIQSFLQLNNLTQTLHSFKNQPINKIQKSKAISIQSQKQVKQTIIINKKQAQQLNRMSMQIIQYQNPQIQNQLRQYLQKTDIKILKKVFQRMKKANKNKKQEKIVNIQSYNNHKNNTIKSNANLLQLKFFKNLLNKQNQNYQNIRIEQQYRRNNNPLLQQSRQYQNQWQNPYQLGYQINQFNQKEQQKVIRELLAIKPNDYISQIIKYCSYPQKYYQQIQQYKERNNFNIHDKFYSKLPEYVKFSNQKEQKTEENKSKYLFHIFITLDKIKDHKYHSSNINKNIYPLEMNQIVYDCYDLKIIYDRHKTGFEQQRDIKIVINEVLAGKYQIISNLGQAQFSNAIQVKDLTNQKRFCLKIIQNNKEYFDQSLDQIKILKYIKANCNPDQCCLLNIHDFFYHKEHLMIMTQLLKDTLLYAYQMNRDIFMNLRNVQIFTRQILIALQKLHQLHIIHTDLKPENIMIKSYTNKTLKVIDLGSSIFFHDQTTFYVSTRSYRAPQIILGISYDGKIDIWSLGCIIAEMFTGEVLFNAQSSAALLALIQGLRGPWPSWMLEKGVNTSKFFTKNYFIYEQLKDQNGTKIGKSRIYTPKMTNMKARIKSDNKNFIDFLSKCLKIDPSIRMSAIQALNHPFITQTILQ